MDKLESFSSTLSNLTMYDLKSMYNQAKNVVLNVSEMEGKVREATNDDPWGASSTLMGEIAQGTFNFAHFNEIMPCIYGRFMEKEARQWRQIYKALQLLEYLIKNGSERVVDDARSHISTIKMLRNFHYIDDKGKDEGINVRNRSKELVELLSDVEKIRSERRKAKNNKSKFTGVGNDVLGFSSGSGGRYGGFGSDSFHASGGSGGYANDHWSGSGSSNNYGGGSSNNYGGGGSGSFHDNNGGRRQFEEYDAGGDEISQNVGSSNLRSSSSLRNPSRKASMPTPAPARAPAPVEDLLGGFDDDAFGSTPAAPAPAPVNKALPAVHPVSLDDDDFADFQAAPVVQTPTVASGPVPTTAKPNLMDLLNTSSVPARPPVQAQPPPAFAAAAPIGFSGGHRPSPSLSAQPSQYTSPILPQQHQQQQPFQPQSQNLFGGMNVMQPAGVSSRSSLGAVPRPATTPATAAAKPAGSANFDDLWSLSLGSPSSSSGSKPAGGAAGGKSIQDLQKEKAMASIWGSGQQQQKPAGVAQQPAFPAFGGSASSASGAGDDLLL